MEDDLFTKGRDTKNALFLMKEMLVTPNFCFGPLDHKSNINEFIVYFSELQSDF